MSFIGAWTDAWRSTTRAWSLWAVIALALLVQLVPLLAVGLAVWGFVESFGASGEPTAGAIMILLGSLALGGLVSAPAWVVQNGAVVRGTFEVQEGRSVTTGQTLRFGLAAFWRVLLIDLLIAVLSVVFVIVLLALFMVVAFISCLCFIYPLIYALEIGGIAFIQGLEALSVRNGVLSGVSPGAAVGAAWRIIRTRFRHALPILLSVIGINLVFGMITSAFYVPAYFMIFTDAAFLDPTSLTNPADLFTPVLGVYLLGAWVVSLFVGIPFQVLIASLWTAFWRQLAGLVTTPAPGAMPEPPRDYLPEPPTGPPTASGGPAPS